MSDKSIYTRYNLLTQRYAA